MTGESGGLEEFLHGLIRSYRQTLPGDRRRLLERFRYVHAARKGVGVGSVFAVDNQAVSARLCRRWLCRRRRLDQVCRLQPQSTIMFIVVCPFLLSSHLEQRPKTIIQRQCKR